MVKFFDIIEKTNALIRIRVDRKIIRSSNLAIYAIYDTDPSDTTRRDYIQWRVISEDVDPTVPDFDKYVDIVLNDSKIYPSYESIVVDYTTLEDSLLRLVSSQELEILRYVKDRIDLVRKRLPNPGTYINDTDGIGDGGIVAYAGGFYKKFAVGEYLDFINGALLEINITAPITRFWWEFLSVDMDMNPNPYKQRLGVPVGLQDLIVQASTIRALESWGILEVDLGFQTVDSGLSISFNRSPLVKSWLNDFINRYESQKRVVKMNYANHHGVGVGTSPLMIGGIYGRMVDMSQLQNTVGLNTMLGFGSSSNRPM